MACFFCLQCSSLEKLGYESLVIVTSEDSHTEMGSGKGRHFIEHFDLVIEFMNYQHSKNMPVHKKFRDVTHSLILVLFNNLKIMQKF